MRILFVSQIVPYPPHGGVLQRGFNLLRELGRHHEVDLLAFHHPDELPAGTALEQSKRELGAFCRSVEYFALWPKQSFVHRLVALAFAAVYPRPFSVLAHRSGKLAARIEDLCLGPRPPDVVHLDTMALAPYARNCGTVPVVVTHHNVESQLMQRRAEHERGWLQKFYVRLQAKRLRSYEEANSGKFPVNIMVSESDAETLRGICPRARMEVIPNGVDTEYFHPRWGSETPTLIFTGGMNMFANRDGVDWFLVEVWPLVKRRVSGVRFIAIGQRPSPLLMEVVAKDGSVEAPGFVQDVRPWVERAAVYVVPLRVGGGTKLKVLDAMAQGKAIVCTTLGAEGIEVKDAEEMLIADSAHDFAERIVQLLGAADERLRLGRAAREKVEERYSWGILGRRLAEVYAGAAKGSRE